MRVLSRKGNVVAAILIIALMLVSAIVMVQTQVFPTKTDLFQRTSNAFSQLVYTEPNDVIEAFALNGYQADNRYWYCGDRSSVPGLDKVFTDFSSFSEAYLEGRLETLRQEFPNYDVEISRPQFSFVGESKAENTVENIVSVNVSNLTVSIKEGTRKIGTTYDLTEDYAMHFWYMYSVLGGWLNCNNGGVFSIIDTQMENRACAYYKDMCYCAYDPTGGRYTLCQPGDEVGKDCNPSPCGLGGADGGRPRWDDSVDGEKCEDEVSEHCQDFTNGDRRDIGERNGVTREDLRAIGNKLGDAITQTFAGNPVCTSMNDMIIPNTGITCRAKITDPIIENRVNSAYVFHQSPCPQEQLDGTCGIIEINLFDSVMCADPKSTFSGVWGGSNYVPTASSLGDDGEDLVERMRVLGSIGSGGESGCVPTALKDDAGNPALDANGKIIYELKCPGGLGVAIDDANFDTVPILDCNPGATLGGANQGDTGKYDNSSLMAGVSCNPLPTDAHGGPEDVATVIMGGTSPGVKQLKDFFGNSGGVPMWQGMNGWLDRRGAMNIEITCSDPGTDSLEELQVSVVMRVLFRHGCDVTQNRFRTWTPAVCGLSGEVNIDPCSLDCTDSDPCTDGKCELDSTGAPYCKWYATNTACAIGDPVGECKWGTCVEDPPGNGPPHWTCDDTILQNKSATTQCGTGANKLCNLCDGAGTCQVANGGNGCSLSVNNQCEEALCNSGTCVVQDKPPGAECLGSSCASCECNSGEITWTLDPSNTCESQPATAYWNSCTTEVYVGSSCSGGPTGGYVCQPGAIPTFDTQVCCPGPSLTNIDINICTDGDICCTQGGCLPSEACGGI